METSTHGEYWMCFRLRLIFWLRIGLSERGFQVRCYVIAWQGLSGLSLAEWWSSLFSLQLSGKTQQFLMTWRFPLLFAMPNGKFFRQMSLFVIFQRILIYDRFWVLSMRACVCQRSGRPLSVTLRRYTRANKWHAETLTADLTLANPDRRIFFCHSHKNTKILQSALQHSLEMFSYPEKESALAPSNYTEIHLQVQIEEDLHRHEKGYPISQIIFSVCRQVLNEGNVHHIPKKQNILHTVEQSVECWPSVKQLCFVHPHAQVHTWPFDMSLAIASLLTDCSCCMRRDLQSHCLILAWSETLCAWRRTLKIQTNRKSSPPWFVQRRDSGIPIHLRTDVESLRTSSSNKQKQMIAKQMRPTSDPPKSQQTHTAI